MDTDLSTNGRICLLISSDAAICTQLQDILGKSDIQLRHVALGEYPQSLAGSTAPELILLDCRRHYPQLSIIMAQLDCSEPPDAWSMLAICRGSDTHMIAASFQAGFHDVLTVPFQNEEVCARIHAHLRFHRQQLELREQQERFQKLAEASSEGILIHDKGRILETNQALLDMFGYEYHELIGRDSIDFLEPESRQVAREHFLKNSQTSYALFATKKDGTKLPVKIQGRLMPWKGRSIQVVTIRDISMQRFIQEEQQTLSASLGEKENFGCLVGGSQVMRKVYGKILRSAATDAPVMIYGETGTGKELTARMIFTEGNHHKDCFLPVNCASIPDHLFESQFFGHKKGSFTGADFNHPGYFEQAKGGTLFLDEIGELPMPMQAKLLRILQDHNYTPVGSQEPSRADVRIIAATNQNLHELEKQGRFRSDLFYRLHVLSIDLPPLRARKEDIPLLIRHYFELQAHSGRKSPIQELPSSLLQQFQDYHWPGNVRELFNVLESYLVDGEVRLSEKRTEQEAARHPLEYLYDTVPLTEAIDRFEWSYINKVLQQHQGQKTKTADALNIDRKTLYSKLRKHARKQN